ncbi:MAG: LON peptidase substrate-binding domain-containing protein [Actinomycetia bacterium]|nr:LON peptidase substrate-binding domain-containing protein [Actinomycetes bacterium]
MREIGLFPLPIVLLPTELVPLHIFEQRYRELIGQCYEEDQEFGILLEDDKGRRSVGTTAAITEMLARLPDGRMNVVVTGGTPFEVVEQTSGHLYDTALIELLADEPSDPSEAEVKRLLDAFSRLASAAEQKPASLDENTEGLAFRLAAIVELEVGVKQKLLELRSERSRIVALAKVFEAAASTLAWRALAKKRAPGNGRFEGPSA